MHACRYKNRRVRAHKGASVLVHVSVYGTCTLKLTVTSGRPIVGERNGVSVSVNLTDTDEH